MFDHVKTDLAEFKPYVLKQKCKRVLVLFEGWVVVVEYREAVDNFYGGSKGVARECTLVEKLYVWHNMVNTCLRLLCLHVPHAKQPLRSLRVFVGFGYTLTIIKHENLSFKRRDSQLESVSSRSEASKLAHICHLHYGNERR